MHWPFLVAAVLIIFLERYLSKKGWLPFLSLVLSLSFLGLLFAKFEIITIFLTSISALFGLGIFLFILYSFEHPLIKEIRNELNTLFCHYFEMWIKLPLSFHRSIVIGYAAMLTVFSPVNGRPNSAKL